MASGNSLIQFGALSGAMPQTNYANRDFRNGTPVLSFDASVDWAIVFSGVMPRHYAGGGLTITLVWAALAATSGDVVWTAEIERLQDGVDSVAADSFAAPQSVVSTAPGVLGVVKYSSIPMTHGAQIDGLLAGEAFRLRIKRDADNAAQDTMLDKAQLIRVEIRET